MSTDPTDSEPIMDRRLSPDRRRGDRRRDGAGSSSEDRRTGGDRRQGDRRRAVRSVNQYDMEPDVMEFTRAVMHYREVRGNRFPTAREILQILKDLGYEKRH